MVVRPVDKRSAVGLAASTAHSCSSTGIRGGEAGAALTSVPHHLGTLSAFTHLEIARFSSVHIGDSQRRSDQQHTCYFGRLSSEVSSGEADARMNA
ncbi:hypothetical protein CBOM_01069 [Ceraceosorus bombacis]|uniref:Uncharacterized protein n=1 Tax=Ceraceosorus bombacis TaxID=401625 RepID=A0A0N7L991_9BASI|nr:hypothetical protein CBOM_01069 [Ceraceosorus bombacis]